MSDSYHIAIYPDLDPAKVASIVEGYGIEAAFERWSPWSTRSISEAAERGRELLKKSRAESAKSRQPDERAGGVAPAGYFRLPDDEHIAQACSESGRHCLARLPLHF